MKNLNYNEIKIFINLEIIGEEKLYLFFLKSKKKFAIFTHSKVFFLGGKFLHVVI